VQIILTTTDLETMPASLRRELLLFLAGSPSAAAGEAPAAERTLPAKQLAILDQRQAIALIRSVSFGSSVRILRELLEALAYEKDSDAPAPAQLIKVLRLKDERQLQGHLNALARLVELATHDPSARLARHSRRKGVYVVEPLTREILRKEFSRLAQTGEGEEPLWA
jgi:hypothetical protein